MIQKSIQITIEAPYATYGELNDRTQTIWVVCHGYGQLAHRFIKRFDMLNPKEHFVIAPQGLSKFYLPGHQKVGATWMTKENRLVEIDNYLNYLDKVFETETSGYDFADKNLYLLGFSQGVATIGRWACYRKIPFDVLIAWAGGFPHELIANQFPLPKPNSQILSVIGNQDQYMDEARLKKELDHVAQATGLRPTVNFFEGKHEMQREVLREVVAEIMNVQGEENMTS